MAKNKNASSASAEEFDWSLYEDGWNGYSRKNNEKLDLPSGVTAVYSHEKYAQELLNAFAGIEVPETKELVKNSIVKVEDITRINGDEMVVSINKGSNNIIIDLSKEQRFFNILSVEGESLNKETFTKYIQHPDFRKAVIGMNLSAKIGKSDVSKASLWDGYVETLSNEMREQITKNSTVYMAKILESNNGGFVVEVANAIKAFMPGSMAAANKVTDYDSLVGKTMEVMVESFKPMVGFVVSRKKYLKTITPIHTKELADKVTANPETTLKGRVTGATQFGIFVELSEVLTGMLHKTLLSDELRERLRNGEVVAGDTLDVYVHKIENGRIILSDVEPSKRDAVIAKREAEDSREKTDYVSKRDGAKKGERRFPRKPKEEQKAE